MSDVIAKLFEVITALQNEGWIGFGHRNNLLIQSSERWGFIHLKSAEVKGMDIQKLIKDSTSKITLCLDSATKFNPEDFNVRNIILDETTAVILHLLTSIAIPALARYKTIG